MKLIALIVTIIPLICSGQGLGIGSFFASAGRTNTGDVSIFTNSVVGVVPGAQVAASTNAGVVTVNVAITNFTSYASGTAYTLTATPAQLTFGTTSPGITINQAGTYLITASSGVKYNGSTYASAQTVTLKLRRTNNTAADLTSGSRTVEMPFLVAGAAFTSGDVMALPPIIYTATSGDIVQIFGSLSATPPAGAVLTDSAEIVAIRLY